MRIGESPEVHLPSRESDDLRSMVRDRRSNVEESTRIKNKTDSMLSLHGLMLEQTDIFGKSGLSEINRQSIKLSPDKRIVPDHMLSSVI